MQPNVAIAQTASNALDFIYIDEPTLFLGDSQHIAFALSDEGQTITEAVLTYSINGKTKGSVRPGLTYMCPHGAISLTP